MVETDGTGVATARLRDEPDVSLLIYVVDATTSAISPEHAEIGRINAGMRRNQALRTSGGGGGVEAAGDEEHSESVVVVVAEAAGDAAGEFDESVHGLGAAVG